MSFQLTERILKIKPSATLALAQKAQELLRDGHDVISLTVGEPDWNTLESARLGAVKAIGAGHTKYLPSSGLPMLRKAIAAEFMKDYGVNFLPEEVSISAGGKFVIFSVLQALIQEGDEVIIPAPYWVSYPTLVEMAQGQPRIIQTELKNNFKLTATELQAHIQSNTKMVILNSPSNPTGQTYTLNELSALAKVLRDFPQVAILTDDIYNHLYFESHRAPHILQAAPDLKSRTIVVNGGSKSFSMTGWRIGWVMAPQLLISQLNNYFSQTVSCASSISQYACLAALERGSTELAETVVELRKRMEAAFNDLKEVPRIDVAKPTGAFYFWIGIKECFGFEFKGELIANSSTFCRALLDSERVAVVPGVEFGTEGFFRLSYAVSSDRMAEATRRLSRFISNLSKV